METYIISIGGSIIGILLAIVSYFLVRLINKIDGLATSVNEINIKLGIYDTQVESLSNHISDIKIDIDKLETNYSNFKVSFENLNTEHRIQLTRCQNHN